MTALASAAIEGAPVRVPPLLRRRFGSPGADAVLRATLVLVLGAIPLVAFVPQAAVFIPLVLSTLWLRGPLSGVFPIGLEPVLMAYGAAYAPWLVTLVAAGASAYAELISLYLMRGMVGLRWLERMRGGVRASRVMKLFERRPGIAVALTALSPVPDWITRTLAAVSGYPVARYVIADTLGRTPKLFIPAALGAALHLPTGLLLGVFAGSLVAGITVTVVRWRLLRRTGEAS